MWRAPFRILILLFFIALTCTLQNLAFCWFYIASSWHVVEYSFSVFTLHVAAPYGLLCRCFLIAIFLRNPSSTVFILLAIFTWEIGLLLCKIFVLLFFSIACGLYLTESCFCYYYITYAFCIAKIYFCFFYISCGPQLAISYTFTGPAKPRRPWPPHFFAKQNLLWY